MTKRVWQTDDDGWLIGPSDADESPLEPGVWLIPYGCVETPPPGKPKAGHWWRLVDGEWSEVKIPQPTFLSTARDRLAKSWKALLGRADD